MVGGVTREGTERYGRWLEERAPEGWRVETVRGLRGGLRGLLD